MHGFILVTILATAKSAEAEITMEAAFQGNLIVHLGPPQLLFFIPVHPRRQFFSLDFILGNLV